jgi:hypothetical protein
MFINMVPDHRFNQLKPKSGARVAAGFPCGTHCKDSFSGWIAQHASRRAGALR